MSDGEGAKIFWATGRRDASGCGGRVYRAFTHRRPRDDNGTVHGESWSDLGENPNKGNY